MKNSLFLYLFFLFPGLLFAQIIDDEANKCGIADLKTKAFLLQELGDHWGYGYDDLLNDLDIWDNSGFVIVNSIGKSTLGREMYELTITDNSIPDEDKHRIYIHARTHPGEVQSTWVTNEIINYLLGDEEFGDSLKSSFIFHITPMYNPDGVELEYPRENANGIDIESNWGAAVPEDEVLNLRARFAELMLEDKPVEIALNMHSAYACKRYFVYHHPNGTSTLYSNMEKEFIGAVWSHFPDGIEPYYYYVSWASGTPDKYPESWWWMNHAENVMALTYEDMNCSSAGSYDKTAFAILHGISDYLEVVTSAGYSMPEDISMDIRAYPNPFSDQVFIEWNPDKDLKSAYITDMLGRLVYQLPAGGAYNGKLSWNSIDRNGTKVSRGIYFLNMIFEDQIKSVKLVKQ